MIERYNFILSRLKIGIYQLHVQRKPIVRLAKVRSRPGRDTVPKNTNLKTLQAESLEQDQMQTCVDFRFWPIAIVNHSV